MNALKLSKFRTEGRILGVARPVVGGSSAADLGKVKVVANKWDRIETDVTSDTKRFNPVEDDKKTIGSSGMVWENQVKPYFHPFPFFFCFLEKRESESLPPNLDCSLRFDGFCPACNGFPFSRPIRSVVKLVFQPGFHNLK